MTRAAIKAAAAKDVSHFVENLQQGDTVEFKAPSDFRGWVTGRFVSAENDHHGLWLVVRAGRDEFLIPHSWVRPVR